MSWTSDRTCVRVIACEWAVRPRAARPARLSRTSDRTCVRAIACDWAARLAQRVRKA